MIPFLNQIACVFGLACKCLAGAYVVVNGVFSCLSAAFSVGVVSKKGEPAGKRFASVTALCLLLFSEYSSAAGTALDFDGVNDQLVLPGVAGSRFDVGTSGFAVAAWVKASRTSKNQIIVEAKSSSGDDTYKVFIDTAGRINFAVSTGEASYSIKLGTVFADGEWHHFTAARTSASNRLNLKIATSRSGNIDALEGSYLTDGSIDIGSAPVIVGKDFDGQLDELRFWNREVSTTEAINLGNRALAGARTDLIANYHFEQGVPGGDNTGITVVETNPPGALNGAMLNFAKTGSSSNFVAADIAGFKPHPNLILRSTSRTIGDVSPSMVATSDNPGAITYVSSDTGVATINASTGALTLVSAGTTEITASQDVTTDYIAESTPATLTVKASNSPPTLSGAPASVTVTAR